MVETPTVMVSLGLVFSLAALVLIYQTYLSVLVFRALCDISVVHYRQHYCSASGRSYVPHRIWRIKMVLLYSFAVSILTIGGIILQLAMELSLHWNPQFYLNPIPFHLTFASAYVLGLNGKFRQQKDVALANQIFPQSITFTTRKAVATQDAPFKGLCIFCCARAIASYRSFTNFCSAHCT